ncbi:MAG TPA: hypothetical protein VKY37_06980 [Brumimicrobium sp.]|nr:hypothetical protein [Brumimicrobium sp.]
MKNNLIVAVLTVMMSVGFVPNTQAQEGYEGKRVYLDLGIGLSRYGIVNNFVYNSYGYDRYSLPTLRANLTYGFNHFISGGLYAGYNHYGWKGNDTYYSNGTYYPYEYKDRTSHLSIGARATFHIWAFLNKQLDLGLGVDQLDLYASIMTGARIRTRTNVDKNLRTTSTNVSPHFGPTVGAKYYFTNNMAVFVEAGYGSSSFGVFGITFKF